MNPYLEQETVWHDFHHTFCALVAEMLAMQVRPNYIVKIDRHMYARQLDAEERPLIVRADGRPRHSGLDAGSRQATATVPGPAFVRLPAVDIEKISFLEIRDRETARVVTVIELLSPSNKESGPDREQHLAKRAVLLHSAVHLVEIDLLRGGPRLPIQDLPGCDYYALVSRWETRPRADFWPIALRDPLTIIPIPLHAPHADARLDLQQVLHRIYDAAGYEDYIYRGEPQPRLRREDQEWARQFLPGGM
jgi:hypothetical protein